MIDVVDDPIDDIGWTLTPDAPEGRRTRRTRERRIRMEVERWLDFYVRRGMTDRAEEQRADLRRLDAGWRADSD